MLFLNKGLLIRTLVLLLGPISALGSIDVESIIKDTVLFWLLPANSSTDHSNSCYKDLSEVAWGLYRREEWALTMLDAAGKPEAGILEGNVGWVGSYEQCLGIRKGSIEGQHCWVQLENVKHSILIDGMPIMGICVPISCENKNFRPFTNFINGPDVMSIDCEYGRFEPDMTFVSATLICCVLLIFIIVGTSVDVLCRKTPSVPFSSFLGYFSLYSNGRKLFALGNDKRATFGELNGLKAIAMALVVFVHTFLNVFGIAKNQTEVVDALGSALGQLLCPMYPVNVFFLITGFLTLNGVVRKPPPKGHKCHFLLSYVINRYLKLLVAPAVIAFVFHVAFLPRSSSGPFWRLPVAACEGHWWKMALFLPNWWASSDKCFTSWWFLSASVQLHLMSLCIIIPLINQRYRMSVLSGSAMLVLSWCWVSRKDILMPLFPEGHLLSHYVSFASEFQFHYREIYQHPVLYLGSYLVGMGLAGLLHKHQGVVSLSKKRLFLGWILSSTFLFLALYGLYMRPNRMLRNMHNALGNTMYSVFIAWVLLVCFNTKNKGTISCVLRWKYWLPLSKLGVVEYFYYSRVDSLTFSWASQWLFFFRHWLGTYLMATLATLTIEMPFNAILDSFWISTKTKSSNNN